MAVSAQLGFVGMVLINAKVTFFFAVAIKNILLFSMYDQFCISINLFKNLSFDLIQTLMNVRNEVLVSVMAAAARILGVVTIVNARGTSYI